MFVQFLYVGLHALIRDKLTSGWSSQRGVERIAHSKRITKCTLYCLDLHTVKNSCCSQRRLEKNHRKQQIFCCSQRGVGLKRIAHSNKMVVSLNNKKKNQTTAQFKEGQRELQTTNKQAYSSSQNTSKMYDPLPVLAVVLLQS